MTRVQKFELRVPQDRDGRQLFGRHQRSEKALVAALAAMPVQHELDQRINKRRTNGFVITATFAWRATR